MFLASIPFSKALCTFRHSVKTVRSLHTEPFTVRFAPSPTGHLHLGGLRTALFNYLLAKKRHGRSILRIEDTDQSRLVPGASEGLVRTLKWAGLQFDYGPWSSSGPGGPYVQTLRRAIYDEYIEKLIETGHAYRCFCSGERLEKMRAVARASGSSVTYDGRCLGLEEHDIRSRIENDQGHVVRFRSQPFRKTHYDDAIYGRLSFPGALDDFVLRKTDGLPTYHLASVVDDHVMGVTHVLRGEEWISSLPKHLALYDAFGWTPPVFAHLPLLINADGSKLSKRTGDVAVESYIEKGYEPEALLNFVLLMGWSAHKGNLELDEAERSSSEVLSLDDMVKRFTLEGINRKRGTMNLSKLDFLNKAHLQIKLSNESSRKDLLRKVEQAVAAAYPSLDSTPSYVEKVLLLMKERLVRLTDFVPETAFFFVDPTIENYDASKAMLKKATKGGATVALALEKAYLVLEAEPYKKGHIDSALKTVTESGPLTKAQLSIFLRYALTGQKMGADIASTLELLGRERSLRRLDYLKQEYLSLRNLL